MGNILNYCDHKANDLNENANEQSKPSDDVKQAESVACLETEISHDEGSEDEIESVDRWVRFVWLVSQCQWRREGKSTRVGRQADR